MFCFHDPSFDDFTILAYKQAFLAIKESLLIKRDESELNKSISSAPLFLFALV